MFKHSDEKLDRRYLYPPTQDGELRAILQERTLTLAHFLCAVTPPGPELDRALDALDVALLLCIASVERNEGRANV